MDNPEWRIVDLYIFHKYILAAVELYHAWAQVISLSEYAFVYRDGIDTHLAQAIQGGTLQGVPTIESYSPVAVNRTFAGQGDIGALVGIDERRVVKTFRSFPFGQYHGEIVRGHGREFQTCAICNVQVYIAFQQDGAFAEIVSGRDENGAATICITLIDGFQYGRSAVKTRIAFCPVGSYVIYTVRKSRRNNVLQDFGNFCPFTGFFAGSCSAATCRP